MAEGTSSFLEIHPIQKKRKLTELESTINSELQSLTLSPHDSFLTENNHDMPAYESLHPIIIDMIDQFDNEQNLSEIQISTSDQYMSLLLRNAHFWHLSESNLTLFPQFQCSHG